MIQIIPSELKRLYKVLPRLYRLRLLKVGISVFIMAVLDLVGTGVLLPVLLLVLNENIILENRHMALFYSWMGFDSIRSFVFFICIVVLLFSIIRVCLSAWLQYKQNKTVILYIQLFVPSALSELLFTGVFIHQAKQQP